MREAPEPRIHPSADVDDCSVLGCGAAIWNDVQVRGGAAIGEETSLGKNCYVDANVAIGARCKIQNNVSIYHGVTIKDGVFVGPHVCFTNDRIPRAINPDGTLKSAEDWVVTETFVETGASIGAHSVVLPGLTIGRFALVGAGSVVTRSVPPNGLVVGNPARLVGWVCDCGARLYETATASGIAACPECGARVRIGTNP